MWEKTGVRDVLAPANDSLGRWQSFEFRSKLEGAVETARKAAQLFPLTK